MGSSSSIRNPFIIPGLQKISINPQLNESYTFESFIEGDCNRLGRSAGYAVSQNPGGTSFNPLFIYGNGGLGKTHLANAIGIEVQKQYPEKMYYTYQQINFKLNLLMLLWITKKMTLFIFINQLMF